MAATNIKSNQLPQVHRLTDTDTFVVNASGNTSIISYANIKGNMNGWSSIANKPFDTYNDSYFQAVSDADKIALSLSQSVIDDIELSHKHENIVILDAFSVNTDGKLTWNNIVVGSDYELPIATTDVLGGVKPDGITITVDENGVISGASTYELPKATTTSLGGIMVDGTTITVNSDGVITCINEGSVIATWSSNVEYPVDCVIVYDTTMYKCLEEHTSGDTFDNTKWQALTGEKGDTGVSPTAKTEQTETGATISVTDANGTTTSVLTNGKDGATPHIDETTKHWFIGENDTNIIAEGKDGVSPTATVTKTDTGATITVISGGQTTTADIKNGISTIQTTSIKYTGILTVDGWIGDIAPYIQTITMESITSDVVADFGIIITKDNIETALEEKKQWGYITSVETIDGGIKFYCFENKPTIDLNYQMRVV